ncbi:MAG: hypothetical protein K2X82_11765 [Gemmataceae bacterium]|nr:hypothetical protein [Gemmataceae bacterium]
MEPTHLRAVKFLKASPHAPKFAGFVIQDRVVMLVGGINAKCVRPVAY